MNTSQFLSAGQLCSELELCAADPRSFSLDRDCLLSRPGCSGESVAKWAPKLLEAFEKLGPLTEDERRRIKRSVSLLRASSTGCEVTKCFDKLLASLRLQLQALPKLSASLDASNLSLKDCQQRLSALVIERSYLTMQMRAQVDQVRVNAFQAALENQGGVRIENSAEQCMVYFDISFQNFSEDPQLFALLLKHPQRFEEGRLHLAKITAPLAEAAAQLISDGLLSQQGARLAQLIVWWHERVKVVARGNFSAKDAQASMKSMYLLRGSGEDVARRLALLGMAAISEQLNTLKSHPGLIVYPERHLKAMAKIWDSYQDLLPQIEADYTAIYTRLQALKPVDKRQLRDYLRFTKLLYGEGLLPEPAVFRCSWSSDIKPLKQVQASPARSKSNKKPKKKGLQKRGVAAVSSPLVVPEKIGIIYAKRVRDFLCLDLPVGARTANAVEHGFGMAVDEYVFDFGVQTVWLNPRTQSKDKLYSIPGEIEFSGGKVKRGLFTYCFEEQNPTRCYHRCFMAKAADEMVSEYAKKRFWEIDFPHLGESVSMVEAGDEAVEPALDESRVKSAGGYVVEIEDPRNAVVLRLFKLKDQ